MARIGKREPTKQEVQKILEILEEEDPSKEQGGFILWDESRGASVTSEHNYAICRSSILLDLNSIDWSKVKALWICAELPKPPGYVDECCDGCEEIDTSRLELAKLSYAQYCASVPRKDWVSPGQRAWSKKFGITVVVYQRPYPDPAEGEENGTWDIYDPINTEEKAIGVNLGQLSKLAGIASVEDREHLDAVARLAIEEREKHEAKIYEAWRKMNDACDRGFRECEAELARLRQQTEFHDARVKQALYRIGGGSSMPSIATVADPFARSGVPARDRANSPLQMASGKEGLFLPPASAKALDSPLFSTPPIEAFQYVEVQKL